MKSIHTAQKRLERIEKLASKSIINQHPNGPFRSFYDFARDLFDIVSDVVIADLEPVTTDGWIVTSPAAPWGPIFSYMGNQNPLLIKPTPITGVFQWNKCGVSKLVNIELNPWIEPGYLYFFLARPDRIDLPRKHDQIKDKLENWIYFDPDGYNVRRYDPTY